MDFCPITRFVREPTPAFPAFPGAIFRTLALVMWFALVFFLEDGEPNSPERGSKAKTLPPLRARIPDLVEIPGSQVDGAG